VNEAGGSVLDGLEMEIVRQYCKFLCGLVEFNELLDFLEVNNSRDAI
jgi:hypothetical protein